MNYPHTSAY